MSTSSQSLKVKIHYAAPYIVTSYCLWEEAIHDLSSHVRHDSERNRKKKCCYCNRIQSTILSLVSGSISRKPTMDQSTALRLARECFPDIEIQQVSYRSIARLWAGMGNIYRVTYSASPPKSFIVKYIRPNLPGKPSVGDKRKLDSYIVEANLYEKYAKMFIEDHNVRLPMPYKVERNMQSSTKSTIIICMQSLDDMGYDYDDVHERVMHWMASFHAATWQMDTQDVQPVGSYWHLETRQGEWQDMPRSGWEGRLKLAAKAIDERLKNDPLQCWVHGDAKDANILKFDADTVAFCDFQYVGRGPPTKDLAYYFCSNHVDDAETQERLLSVYFDELVSILLKRGVQPLPTRTQLEDSLELSFCDFCRFMSGWGYWGYDLSAQVRSTLQKIDGGRALKSEDEYRLAVGKAFES